MNPEPDHPPPEKMRQEVELALHPPDDFTNNSPSGKYEPLEEKSTYASVEPAVGDFICVAETTPPIGVYHEISADGREKWTVDKVPNSWGRARSSRLVAPSPDGGVERPHSLVKPFNSEAEALLTFKRMTKSF
jgi:hypothetical protein